MCRIRYFDSVHVKGCPEALGLCSHAIFCIGVAIRCCICHFNPSRSSAIWCFVNLAFGSSSLLLSLLLLLLLPPSISQAQSSYTGKASRPTPTSWHRQAYPALCSALSPQHGRCPRLARFSCRAVRHAPTPTMDSRAILQTVVK